MNIWEILGISETTNISIIKKAFAFKSKMYHPEDHPEEFKRLRMAYKAACKYAKSNADINLKSSGENKQTNAGNNDKYVSFDFSDKKESNEDKTKEKTEENTKDNSKENLHESRESRQTKIVVEDEVVAPLRKSLFERMHGETAQASFNNTQTQVKRKSLYERMHGEKIPTENERQTTQIHNVNQSEGKSEISSNNEEFNFNFEQIVDTDTVERLIEELNIIFNNPFLRNNIVFWDIYFDHNWNGAILNSQYAADKIVSLMCKFQGWFETTLNKLEAKMKISLDNVRANKVKIQSVATQYEIGYNSFILKKIGEYGCSTNLDNEDSIKCYLSIYFDLVRRKNIVFRDMQ